MHIDDSPKLEADDQVALNCDYVAVEYVPTSEPAASLTIHAVPHPRSCAQQHGQPCECGDDVREQALREAQAGDWQFKAGIAIAVCGPLLVALLLVVGNVMSAHDPLQDLLAVAQKCEAMLTRQKWLPDGTDPESVLLREARAAIAKATQVAS